MAKEQNYVIGDGDIADFFGIDESQTADIALATMPPEGQLPVINHGAVEVLDSAHGKNWSLLHGDCVNVARQLPPDCIDLTIHSPPFSQLYVYSDSEADMGNCKDDAEFIEQYSFLIRELYRITVPGKLCVVHCKDLPNYLGRDGCSGLRDFPGMIVRAFEDAGWSYHSRVLIWKCPVIERARTQSYGLLHAQVARDSTASRQGMPDYLVVFRKWDGKQPDEFLRPVHSPGANKNSEIAYRFHSYEGSLPPGSNFKFELREVPQLSAGNSGNGTPIDRMEFLINQGKEEWSHRDYSIQVWQRYASPVWFDIQQMDVLNGRKGASQPDDERHICPLQIPVITRAVHLWSNPGDVVFTPFAGIGSELVGALRRGRKALGIELKDSYFSTAAKNCRIEEAKELQKKLF